jgi:uncharacterized membrane protein
MISNPQLGRNMENVQRLQLASLIAGGTLIGFGLQKTLKYRSVAGAGLVIAGAALLKRGVSVSPRSETSGPRLGSNATIPYQQGIRVDRYITINAGREQVYSFWRNLDNLPRFMKHVCCVKQLDQRRSHWIVEGPAGQKIEWDAEIINEIPNELIAWRSLPGTSVNNAGSVRFDHATAGRGTKVSVSLQYGPPAGQVGVVLARLLGKDPDEEVDTELHRLKNIIEAGEIPTSAGQSAGRPDEHTRQAQKTVNKQLEKVHHASEESFPASDAPAYSHVNGH